ncbi:hypothetical protein [Tessaracoccus antarcticus]|uniref:CARDB domain-containing protein n=1 Tax=Tessaracoccus antarcticus TaxID=2479848 RepID=A0A3M0G1Q8_9ACTN|nr:hypothetical protein [Tessaracoccus antarcticus]RMB58725.1 hypothetical protein EAX62_11345 [Tessaracoccus antarcticus]
MAEQQVWAEGTAGTAIGAALWNGRTVLATDWSGGALNAFAVENGERTPWGDGYQHPEGISIRGNEALIAEQAGDLLHQDLLQPGRANAVMVAGGLGSIHAVVHSDDGATAFVTDHGGGRLIAVDLATGDVQVIASGLLAPIGLAIASSGEFYITEQGPGTLTRIDTDGSRSVVLNGLVSPFLLSWTTGDRTALLLTQRAPVHRVGLVELTQAVPRLQPLVGRGVRQPSQALVCGDRLVITGENRLLSLDASAGLVATVRLGVPETPMWPGAWADVEIDTGVTGYTRADLDITIDAADAITLSSHPAADADPNRPHIRLLAGAVPCDTHVVVRDAITGDEVGRAAVSVGFDASPVVDGPPLWLDNPTDPPPLMHVLASKPGVDDTGSLRPRDAAGNVLSQWKVVVVLVDTGDARWSTKVTAATPAPTIASARVDWRGVFSGANDLNTWFSELSAGRLGMTLVTGSVLGPVSLGGTWGDWHTMDSDGTWRQKGEAVERVVGALQGTPGVDWTYVDAVFLVTRSAGGNFVWPRSTVGKTLNVTVRSPGGKDVAVKLATLTMPHDQPTSVGFTNVEVSAHELGHTMGLQDIYMTSGYTTEMAARDLGGRELMGNEQGLPHLSARHKLLLGFLDPAHVRSFTPLFAESAITLTLVPIASGLPAPGRFSAVELKLAPKLSWFFELRQSVPGRIGDTATFPPGGEIICYDAINYSKPAVIADARRTIILLNDDGDGEGPLLVSGQDYEDINADDQVNIQRFRLEVLSITAGAATVRIDVGRVDQPDPVLINNCGEDGDYKSPDIEVRNSLSDADPSWLNKPIIGEPNRIVAKVHNEGGLDAPKVSVKFQVLPFNTDDKDSDRWTKLPAPDGKPSVTHDVKKGATVEFETHWQPMEDRHYCIQARIDRYVDVAGAAANEPDVDNNLAQSNYFTIYSKPSSPATREVSFVEVHNPFDHEIDARVEIAQDSTQYRSYVDHRWLHLSPGQTRMVRLEVESKATSIWDVFEHRWPAGRTWLRSWLPGQQCTDATGGGVTIAAVTAVGARLRTLEQSPGVFYLRVEGPEGAPRPTDGTLVVRADYEDGTSETLVGALDVDGLARFEHEHQSGRATAWFSGNGTHAPVSGWEFELLGD